MAIEVNGLRRNYGRFEAVRGVSFQVRRGELFALLGTNGAGKTTTIEVLEGLQAASGGQVTVLGMDPVRDRSAVRARTGVMLQSGGFTGALTVRETVQIWRSLTARPRGTAEVIHLVGLGDRGDVAVEQLSGGERRRLELALAVLGRPELLFLDEPTTGMDPVSRRYTWEVVGELRDGGTTVLLTTHYLDEAEDFADQVAIMQAGRIVTSGTPDEVVGNLPGRISFVLPGAIDPPALTGAALTVDGPRVTYRSGQVQADLTRLLTWANTRQLMLLGLSAGPATLEDVFLGIADRAGTDDRTRAEARR
jgi:ABC-2 type transport system ATP-binding protein